MGERTAESMNAVREQALGFAQSIAEQAAHRAVNSMFRVRGEAVASADRLKGRDPRHVLDAKVMPTVKETALQAASAALELWEAAAQRAEGAAESVSESALHLVTQPAANVRSRVGSIAHETTSQVAHKAEDVSSVAKGASERTRLATRHAAEATVSTGKDTAASLFWMATASGVVLYVIMDRERREQVFGIAKAVFNQVAEIVRDYQGYDGEFE